MSAIALKALKSHLKVTPFNLDGFTVNQGISYFLSSRAQYTLECGT
jgi:hypothetical protein